MTELIVPQVQLNDGNLIPQLGLGVWRLPPDETEQVVSEALELGYRHFDTASIYDNEAAVGRAIAASGVPREELFVTTKLWNTDQEDPHQAFEASLERLGLDYVDLYLIHWPIPHLKTAVGAWRGLVEIVGSDQCNSIGVSNFEIAHLNELITETGVVPAVDQVELHPLHQRRELRQFCAERGIAIEAWGPLSQGKSDRSSARCLRPLPQSTEKARPRSSSAGTCSTARSCFRRLRRSRDWRKMLTCSTSSFRLMRWH